MGRHTSSNATVSAYKAVPLTASNSTVFETTRALYIGVSGDVTVKMEDQDNVTFKNVPVGIFPIQCIQFRTTSTASEVIALY